MLPVLTMPILLVLRMTYLSVNDSCELMRLALQCTTVFAGYRQSSRGQHSDQTISQIPVFFISVFIIVTLTHGCFIPFGNRPVVPYLNVNEPKAQRHILCVGQIQLLYLFYRIWNKAQHIILYYMKYYILVLVIVFHNMSCFIGHMYI